MKRLFQSYAKQQLAILKTNRSARYLSSITNSQITSMKAELVALAHKRPSQITTQAPGLVQKLEATYTKCDPEQKKTLSIMLSEAYIINAERLSRSSFQKDTDLAIQQLKEATRLDPANTKASDNLEMIFLYMGMPSKLGRLVFSRPPGDPLADYDWESDGEKEEKETAKTAGPQP